MAKFLDLTGLGQFKTKLQTFFEGIFLKKTEYTAPTIQIVKVNGSPLSPDGRKAVNIDLSTYAIKTEVTKEIAQAVSGIQGFDAQVVSELPQTGAKGILYLVANSGSGQNIYDEYLWITDKYEKLGTREIDLSAYAKKTEIPTKVSQLENDKGYQTSAQVQSAISTATQDMATNAGVDSKLESYAKTADLPTAITDEEIDGLITE